MIVWTSAEDNPQPMKLRDAARKFARLTDGEIDSLLATTDHLDIVELARGLEEAHGIEIDDEDLFSEGEDPDKPDKEDLPS